MVVNPVTIHPDETLADALQLMASHRISGIPVVESDGRLVGILTNRDVRFADDPRQRVSELMTHNNLITVRESVGKDEAKRLLHQHRIEKLLVVDDAYRCTGLITVKDIEKAQLFPNRRGRPGRHRGRRRCGQGRHRAGLDLHDPHGRRGRRAAIHRDHRRGRGMPQVRRAGDRRWRHQIFG
jgi:IMP dehydrogenase